MIIELTDILCDIKTPAILNFIERIISLLQDFIDVESEELETKLQGLLERFEQKKSEYQEIIKNTKITQEEER